MYLLELRLGFLGLSRQPPQLLLLLAGRLAGV
jgi:hypothetical protein